MKTSFLVEFQKKKKLTNKQMADLTGVCEKTWRNYKKSASPVVPKRFALAFAKVTETLAAKSKK